MNHSNLLMSSNSKGKLNISKMVNGYTNNQIWAPHIFNSCIPSVPFSVKLLYNEYPQFIPHLFGSHFLLPHKGNLFCSSGTPTFDGNIFHRAVHTTSKNNVCKIETQHM